jgi:hypothetical protein
VTQHKTTQNLCFQKVDPTPFNDRVLKYGTAVSTFKGCKNYVFLIIEPGLKILR